MFVQIIHWKLCKISLLRKLVSKKNWSLNVMSVTWNCPHDSRNHEGTFHFRETGVKVTFKTTSNQSSPEYSSLLILQIYIFFTTVSKCHENNGHSAWCVGVLCVCYHLCPWNHMEGHIWSAFVNHGGFCCCCCCFFLIPVELW